MARIALVLGAGGAVGHGFHAGVLGALADRGWDARNGDVIVGTSAGSIVAGLLRAGMPAADVARRAAGEPLSADGAALVARAQLLPPGTRPLPPRRRAPGRAVSPALLRRAVRAPWAVPFGTLAAAALPAGMVPTEHIAAPFDALFATTWPRATTWIVAVDIDSGRRTVFGRDEVTATMGQAARASCAVPGYFEPIEIGGRRYVDGGVHSTTNADLVASERPDLVLVSVPMSAARGAARLGPELAIRQFARLSLSREVAALRRRGIPVFTFAPTAADLEVMRGDALDSRKTAPVCARARETTAARLARSDVVDRLAPLFA